MEAHRIETTLTEPGKLTLEHLPFQKGDSVEVIVLINKKAEGKNPYSLRGQKIVYHRPTDPVAENDWEALK